MSVLQRCNRNTVAAQKFMTQKTNAPRGRANHDRQFANVAPPQAQRLREASGYAHPFVRRRVESCDECRRAFTSAKSDSAARSLRSSKSCPALGDGVVALTCREVQRKYFDLPNLSNGGVAGPLLPGAALLNICGRSPTTSAAVLCLRARVASPRADSFDDDVNSGQGALDLALHAVDFRLQEFLHFLEFGHQRLKFVYRT